jgi:hypothetical protein
MDRAPVSFELLAHFDKPSEPRPLRRVPVRGVRWVLQWAAALGVLYVAGCVLAQFAYCLTAERTLLRAARAGALEATLPRATRESIRESIERRLTSQSWPPDALQIRVQQNGLPIAGQYHTCDGDQVSVTLTIPAAVVIPQWLRRTSFWSECSQIEIRADRRVPARKLAASSAR